jgi:uracil-DNA glycosylase family 4
LARLETTIPSCTRCPRLRTYCREIARTRKREFRDQTYWGRPVPGFGDPEARLLIVGLAPAAHGANRTGRMFTGDSSGDWLYEALHRHGFANQPGSISRDDGLTLTDCFITAAARCAPPGNKPALEEMNACQTWMEQELALLKNVRVVLVLGRIAWERWLKTSGWWDRLSPKERPAFGHGWEHQLANGTTLLCSFHPSRQNTNTGKLTRAMWYRIFERARVLVEGGRGGRGGQSSLTPKRASSS